MTGLGPALARRRGSRPRGAALSGAGRRGFGAEPLSAGNRSSTGPKPAPRGRITARTLLLMVAHRMVDVNGARLHIPEQGEGPLVVLLHGFPESWHSWHRQFGA